MFFNSKCIISILSNPFGDNPLKSLILGRAIFTNLSKNSYILSFLKDTFNPAFVPFLVLKFEIDFLNFVTTGFCPVSKDKSFSHDFIIFDHYHLILSPYL